MTALTRYKRAVAKGTAQKKAIRVAGVKPATVRSWRFRGLLKDPPPPVAPPAWMQSIDHDSSHLVDHQGRAVCDPERITGIIGRHWFPRDYVRKCSRCMGRDK